MFTANFYSSVSLLVLCCIVVICFFYETSAISLEESIGCWSNNEIPYIFDGNFSREQKIHIKMQTAVLHSTCLKWVDMVEVTGHRNVTRYVTFVKINESACYTELTGYSRGGRVHELAVRVHLHDSCFFERKAVLHEMMHAVGIEHEHQRADRNCYVTVDDDVERHKFHDQFSVASYEKWLNRFPYDKYSVMHFKSSSLMKDKNEKWYHFGPFSKPLGNAHGTLTFIDRWKLMYRFCGAPHFCDIFPLFCDFVDELETYNGC